MRRLIKHFNKLSIIGLGYIGLPTAVLLASKKQNVVRIDIDDQLIENVNRGEIQLSEPFLPELLQEVVKKGYLRATKELEPSDVSCTARQKNFHFNYFHKIDPCFF